MAKQTFTTGQVLTAAQMTSLQQTAMGGGSATAKTASYTLVAADAGTSVLMNSASATTITVNTALFAAGDTVYIQNIGAGVSTITAGTATVTSSAALGLAQWEGGTLYFTSTSAAIFLKGAGAAAPGGAGNMVQIATGSLSGASVTISSLSAYTDLLLFVYEFTNATADGQLRVRINNDSSAVYWFSAGTYGRGSTSPGRTIDNAQTAIEPGAGYNYERTASQNISSVKLTNCKNAGFTDYMSVSSYYGANYSSSIGHGVYPVSAAVSSLVLSNSGGNFSTGTYYLWGA